MIRFRLEHATALLAAFLLSSCGDDSSGPAGPGGSDAALSGLALSGGALTPPFDPDHTTYTLSVSSGVGSLTVAASVAVDGPSVTVEAAGLAGGSVAIAPGKVSPPIALSTGANLITVRTLSQDGSASRAYGITVTRGSGNPGPKICPTVDRGSATDGVTTITVIQAPRPVASGAPWSGWHETILESRANNNGVVYTVRARWNRVGQTVRGSVTWVTGNDSSTHWRDGASNAPWVQDQLDTQDQVRSIDLAWLGGTTKIPRNGYVNLSSTYADAAEHLVATGVSTGVLAHFGNSGGSMMGANALANHRMHEVWDGIVLGGGPFWVDLVAGCTDNTSPLFLGAGGRALIDDWTWREVDGSRPCEQQSGADPSFACMSLLGPDAAIGYPHTTVAVVTGANEQQVIATAALAVLQPHHREGEDARRPERTAQRVEHAGRGERRAAAASGDRGRWLLPVAAAGPQCGRQLPGASAAGPASSPVGSPRFPSGRSRHPRPRDSPRGRGRPTRSRGGRRGGFRSPAHERDGRTLHRR